jgi:sirohydrochlorin ferrochelatase
VAAALINRTGQPIRAVSLLHSCKVPPDTLGGEAAVLLEAALIAHLERFPEAEAGLLPLFFGPSAALTEYVPARLVSVRERFPGARVRLAPWLVNQNEGDSRLAEVLADQVRATARARGWSRPRVVLVDHGSPQPAVAEVRNHLGQQVRAVLGHEIADFAVASMERREGDAYAFNEPLLASALSTPPFNRGEVVVALQFLSPGRHAGPGGDIATICAAVEAEHPDLRTQMTEPIALDARLVELLAERMQQAVPV